MSTITTKDDCFGHLGHGGLDVGGADEEQAIKTIHAAMEKGVNLFGTAPHRAQRLGRVSNRILCYLRL